MCRRFASLAYSQVSRYLQPCEAWLILPTSRSRKNSSHSRRLVLGTKLAFSPPPAPTGSTIISRIVSSGADAMALLQTSFISNGRPRIRSCAASDTTKFPQLAHESALYRPKFGEAKRVAAWSQKVQAIMLRMLSVGVMDFVMPNVGAKRPPTAGHRARAVDDEESRRAGPVPCRWRSA